MLPVALLHLALAVAPSASPAAAALRSVASLVLRSRLRECQSVDVAVDASPASVLSGAVDAVVVSGRRWCTPLNLSCAELDVRVGKTAIDASQLLAQRRIVLRQPSLGDATMSFSSADWSNFLRHPLMQTAVERKQQRRASDATAVDASVSFARSTARVVDGGVKFTLDWDRRPMVAQLGQGAGSGAVEVRAAFFAPSGEPEDEDCPSAGRWLADLFQTLVIDLDGCALTFRSLGVEVDGGARAATAARRALALRLDLDVCVTRFPSLDINF